MKLLALLLTISTYSFASELNETCTDYVEGRTEVIRITKSIKSQNELYISVAIDHDTCEFKSDEDPIKTYWIMRAEGKRDGKYSCENILPSEARRTYGYQNEKDLMENMAKRVGSDEIELTVPSFRGMGGKVGRNVELDERVSIKLSTKSGSCTPIAILKINNKPIEFDQLYLRVFPTKVTIKKDSKKVKF